MGVSTTAKRGDARSSPQSGSHLQHEVIGIVLITAALLILLSLISFLPSDPVFFVGHDEGTVQAHNFIGKAGATVAAFCFWLIGGAAYLLPFLLAIVGWRCFSVGTLSVTLQSAGG